MEKKIDSPDQRFTKKQNSRLTLTLYCYADAFKSLRSCVLENARAERPASLRAERPASRRDSDTAQGICFRSFLDKFVNYCQ